MSKPFFLLLALAGAALADEVLLSEGKGKLTGTLGALRPDGGMVWKMAASSQEVRIRPGMARSVSLQGGEPIGSAPFVVELRSGDFIPASLVRIDGRELVLSSPGVGERKVPREAVATIRSSVSKSKVMYPGVREEDEWKTDDANRVEIGLGGIKTKGAGAVELRSNKKLPRNFRIRATFRWDQNTSPRFLLHFADPFVERGGACDRYFLQLVNTGVEIKRQSSMRRIYTSVGRAALTQKTTMLREVMVEVSLIRDSGTVVLSIDGKEVGRWVDPLVERGMGKVPQADGWGFSFGDRGGISEIRDISVFDLGEEGKLIGAEGDKGKDLVVNLAGEKLSGSLLGTEGRDDGLVLLLQSAFQKEPLRIGAKDVLGVSFGGASREPSQGPLVVRMLEQGLLHVSSAEFDGTKWTLEHPVLGRLDAAAAVLTSVEWMPRSDNGKKERQEP